MAIRLPSRRVSDGPACLPRGLLLALIALVSQLVLGGLALPEQVQEGDAGALAAVATLCQGGAPAQPDHPVHPRGACLLAATLALPGMLPAAGFAPALKLLPAHRAATRPPPPRAPPRPVATPRARAPPFPD